MTQSAGSLRQAQEEAQELGRVERPAAEQYRGRRKLLLVPLVYSPAPPFGPGSGEPEGAAALQNYWEQMQTQVAALENALGGLQRIYHETITAGEEEGLEQLHAGDRRSHAFVSGKRESGAVLEAAEDTEILLETLDLQRCLMIPMTSPTVAGRLQEWHADANRRRYEHIASRIDETLTGDGVGLLLISERHQVQFPSDIEVFYVSPPALDEFHRWLQNWATRQRQATPSTSSGQAQGEAVAGIGGDLGSEDSHSP